MRRADHLVIGKMVSHHGVRGEIKIYPFTDRAEKFLSFPHLYIRISSHSENIAGREESALQRLPIVQCRLHKNMVLVKYEGFDTIEKGISLPGHEVLIEREYADDGEEGHFIVDLIGLRVLGMEGEEYGVLADVIQNTAQDLYEIRKPDGSTFLVPVVDEFVKEIRPEEGYVRLSLIEGLMS